MPSERPPDTLVGTVSRPDNPLDHGDSMSPAPPKNTSWTQRVRALRPVVSTLSRGLVRHARHQLDLFVRYWPIGVLLMLVAYLLS